MQIKIFFTLFSLLFTIITVKAQIGFYTSNKLLFCKPTNLEGRYDKLAFGFYGSSANPNASSRTTDIRTLTGWSNRIGIAYKHNKLTYFAEFGRTLEGYATEEIAGFYTDERYGSSSVNLYVRHYKYFKHHGLGIRYDLSSKFAIGAKAVYQKKAYSDSFLEIGKIYLPEIPEYFGNAEASGEAVYTDRPNRDGQNENTTFQLEIDLRYNIWKGLALEVGYMKGLTPISKIGNKENYPYQQAITTGLRYDFFLSKKNRKS